MRTALLAAAALLLAAACAAPGAEPSESASAGPLTSEGRVGRLADAAAAVIGDLPESAVLSTTEVIPGDPESATVGVFADIWTMGGMVDGVPTRFGWGTTEDGGAGTGATVELLTPGEFAAESMGGFSTCAAVVETNLQISGLYEIVDAPLFGYAGKHYIEGFGDGNILYACADVANGVIVVRVPEALFANVGNTARPIARPLFDALTAAEDPFGE